MKQFIKIHQWTAKVCETSLSGALRSQQNKQPAAAQQVVQGVWNYHQSIPRIQKHYDEKNICQNPSTG